MHANKQHFSEEIARRKTSEKKNSIENREKNNAEHKKTCHVRVLADRSHNVTKYNIYFIYATLNSHKTVHVSQCVVKQFNYSAYLHTRTTHTHTPTNTRTNA